MRAFPFGAAAGGLLFLGGYGALALWSGFSGSGQHSCAQELYVSRAGEISRGPLVLGHVGKDGAIIWSRDSKVIAAEYALEKLK